MCLLLLVGCDPEEPPQRWDYLNMIIKIRVVNAYGENMLDDRVIGNLRENKVTISYNGEKFAMKFGDTRAETEPKLPEWYGLRLYGWYEDAELSFGEFSIDTKEYRGESFTIDWGDDTTSTVAFRCLFSDKYKTPKYSVG